jgi:hypothetical protein
MLRRMVFWVSLRQDASKTVKAMSKKMRFIHYLHLL